MADLVERLRQKLPGIQSPAMRGDNLVITLASFFEPHIDSDEMDDSETWKRGAVDAANEVLNAIHAHYADRIAALEAEASKGERRGLVLVPLEPTNAMTAAYFDEAGRLLDIAAYQSMLDAALIPEAPVRDGWQPIETAPKDGREVLITDGDAVGAGFYDDAPMAHRADAGWFWEDDRANLLIAKNAGATHWMPLPEPPQDNREG